MLHVKRTTKIKNQTSSLIKTRSLNHYPIYKRSIEIKPVDKYKVSVVIVDDMLGAQNKSQINRCFTRGRLENFEVYYLSQSFFSLPRQSIRNNSDRIISIQQSLRGVECIFNDIGAYDMADFDFKEMYRKTWRQKVNYFFIDMTRDKEKVYIVFSLKTKQIYIECIPKNEAL